MKPKTLLIEFGIIAASFILSIAFVSWITGSNFFGKKVVDINLHDTYFVIKLSWQLLLIPGLVLLIIIFLVKETYHHFKYRFPNLILLTAIFLLNVLIFDAMQRAVKYIPLTSSWTIYQPLPALPKTESSPVTNLLITQFLHILFYIELVFMALLVIVAILTGKNWNNNER